MRSHRAQKERALVMANRDTRRNITISTKAKSQTLQENFSKDLVLASGHMGQKCTRRQCIKWAYTPVCSSKWIGHNNLPTRRKASET